VRPGTNVVFSVTVRGPGPFSYQWSYNGADILGATSRLLSVPNVVLEQSGDYAVRVTNPYAEDSATGRLIVLVEPTFLANPQSTTLMVGDTVTLHASVYGTTPMRFRWRRNSSPFIPFETGTTSLTLTNVQLSENGANYDVVATNRANSAPGRVSAKAFLTVLVDTDGDRAPDAWENSNGFSSTNPLDALQDADGDGASNLAEYGAGTNPNDPLSYLQVETIAVTGNTTVQFLALSNKNYTVQFSDGPGGVWSNLAHVLLATNPPPVRMVTVVDSNAVPQRYYRLVTPYRP